MPTLYSRAYARTSCPTFAHVALPCSRYCPIVSPHLGPLLLRLGRKGAQHIPVHASVVSLYQRCSSHPKPASATSGNRRATKRRVRFQRTIPDRPDRVNLQHRGWNAAAEEGSLDLGGHLAARRARTAAAFREGLDPAHYVALTRARLQTLFGEPTSRGDSHKSSFQYDVVACTPAGDVYFQVGDHKAADVLPFWE